MKRHLFFTLLTMALAVSFSSCLKDEMKDSSTIIYGSQKIPNINKFMPSHLLQMMDSLSVIHYGDEPPRFSGHYFTDTLVYKHVYYENPSIPAHSINVGNLFSNNMNLFLNNQIKCIISFRYDNTCPFGNTYYINSSNPDSTYYYFKNSCKPIFTSPDKPSYFEGDKYEKDDFSHAFIIGSGSYFTIYFYDVELTEYSSDWPLSRNHFHRVTANIISGKLTQYAEIMPNANDSAVMDTVSRYRIDNFCWGKEDMGYFNESRALEILIASGGKPTPGDIAIIDNCGMPIYPIND